MSQGVEVKCSQKYDIVAKVNKGMRRGVRKRKTFRNAGFLSNFSYFGIGSLR